MTQDTAFSISTDTVVQNGQLFGISGRQREELLPEGIRTELIYPEECGDRKYGQKIFFSAEKSPVREVFRFEMRGSFPGVPGEASAGIEIKGIDLPVAMVLHYSVFSVFKEHSYAYDGTSQTNHEYDAKLFIQTMKWFVRHHRSRAEEAGLEVGEIELKDFNGEPVTFD